MATGSQPIFYCLTSGYDAIDVLRPVFADEQRNNGIRECDARAFFKSPGFAV